MVVWGYRLETTFLNLLLTNLELLDFAGNGGGEGVDESNVLRDFEMGDLAAAELVNLRIVVVAPSRNADPRKAPASGFLKLGRLQGTSFGPGLPLVRDADFSSKWIGFRVVDERLRTDSF